MRLFVLLLACVLYHLLELIRVSIGGEIGEKLLITLDTISGIFQLSRRIDLKISVEYGAFLGTGGCLTAISTILLYDWPRDMALPRPWIYTGLLINHIFFQK